MPERVKCLKPVIDNRSQCLILGSMPGAMSIQKQEYYANPGNDFWRIIYSVFDSEPDESYNDRVSFVKARGIALWDVLARCERSGSADSEIEGGVPNDLTSLFNEHPSVRCVCFNGKKAHESFESLVALDSSRLMLKRLPSSSSAYARKTIDEKVAVWRMIREYCRQESNTGNV